MSVVRAVEAFINRRPLGWIVISVAAGSIAGNVAVAIGWSL